MKLLLSCDMEGISGIVNWEQVTPGTDEWKRGRKLMAGDVNAAINGAFEAGADAVTVSDAHWHARTLELEELDTRAHLSSGSPSPFSMLQGIDDRPRYDGVAFIGYPAMAGARKGEVGRPRGCAGAARPRSASRRPRRARKFARPWPAA